MISILRDLGIQDYDPGVLTQMLEFSYRLVESFYRLVEFSNRLVEYFQGSTLYMG